jgi:integrase
MKMEKGQNQNHPVKGSSINIEPIRNKKTIVDLKKLLADKPLDLALFIVGINTNLRASDLLSLKVSQVRDLKAGDSIELKEKKTKKKKMVTFNGSAIEAIKGLLSSKEYSQDDFLFIGQRGNVLSVPALNLKIKRWMKRLNLKGNYGCHSLRKTWAFFQYRFFNVQLPILMKALNHSSQAITLRYIGIQDKDMSDVYMNEI